MVIQIPLHDRGLFFFDEGVTFNSAESILRGSILYKDKAMFAGPGIYYFTAMLYKVFGISYLASRYAMAAVFSGAAILVFLISRRMMAEWIAFLTAMVFVTHRVWAFPVWNIIGYSTFSIFFIALALLMLTAFNKRPQLYLAMLVGFVVAIATMFKQDYGGSTAIGISLYLFVWPWLREKNDDAPKPDFSRVKLIAAYVAGGVIVCVPVFAYFALNGALDDYFRNTLIVPLTIESSRESVPLIPLWPLFKQDEYLRTHLFQYVPAVSFRHMLSVYLAGIPHGYLYTETAIWDLWIKLVHYLPYLGLLGVAGVLVRRFLRGALSLESENATAALVVAASVFATQHQPYDFAHLMQMYLPIFVLIGFLVDGLRKSLASKKVPYSIVFGLALAFLAVYLYHTILSVDFMARTLSAKLEGPRGGIYMEEKNRDVCAEAVQFIQENTSPQEPIFVLGYHSLFYFLAERPNPTRFENLWPVEPFPTMNEEILDAIESERVRYLVNVKKVRPTLGAYEDFAPEIAEYVRDNYVVEKKFGPERRGFQIVILKRKRDRTSD